MTTKQKPCRYCEKGDHHLCAPRRCGCGHTKRDQILSSQKYHGEASQ